MNHIEIKSLDTDQINNQNTARETIKNTRERQKYKKMNQTARSKISYRGEIMSLNEEDIELSQNRSIIMN
jgi:hypothetical protein